MKVSLKKLGSALMAFAVIVSLSPVTGSMILADETEPAVPATTESEETEVSKETKETEETVAETPVETEAPKETEKPASEKTKTPEQSSFQKAKDGPAQVSRKIEASIDGEGVLTWKDMVAENVEDPDGGWIDYRVYISGVCAVYENPDKNDATKVFTVKLKPLIDSLIQSGELKKAEDNKYPIWIIAEIEYSEIYASYSDTLTYESNQSIVKQTQMISAQINNGVLTWKSVMNANTYVIYINEFGSVIFTDRRSFPIEKEIDFLIRTGYIKNVSEYNIRIVAYDFSDKVLATRDFDKYKYSTNASPNDPVGSISGLKIENGVMSWDKYDGADGYHIEVYSGGKLLDYYFAESNSTDINNYIANEIYDKDMDMSTTRFTFKVSAVEFSSEDSFGVYESKRLAIAAASINDHLIVVAPNPMSITGKQATVKKKKLRRKKQTLSASKVFAGLGTARGGKIFTKLSGSKKISINKTTGKITIKKNGLKKKKTYKIKVRVQAKGNVGYAASAPQVVTIRIKLK